MRAYNKLVLKVLKIDPLAAAYMVGNDIEGLPCFSKSGDLMALFTWSESPQGEAYWSDIYDKLENLDE